MAYKMVILGAGGLGSIVGGCLALNNPVILIGREPHVREINRNGLKIKGLKDLTVDVEATSDPSTCGDCDLLVVTTKTYDTVKALEEVEFDVRLALSLQNGVVKDLMLEERFGADRVLGAVTILGATFIEPGTVALTLDGETTIGELDGRESERAAAVVNVFSEAGLRTELSGDIVGAAWSKLCQIVPAATLSAASRLEYYKVCKSRPLAELFVMLTVECARVASAKGIEIRDFPNFNVHSLSTLPFEDAVGSVMQRGRNLEVAGKTSMKISMLQDVERGKKTEVHELAGYVIKEAETLGVDVPTIDYIYRLVSGIDGSQ